MTTIIGYDSSRPEMIPANPAAVFPYSDGKYQWSHTRFPNARYRYITVHGDPNADIADYEFGAIYGSAPLVSWALHRRHLHPGIDLTVYCDRHDYADVAHAMAAAQLEWHLFLAVGTDPILTEFDGKKVRACQQSGTGYDTDHVFEPEWLNRP